jgi:hypothetical protein
MNARIVVLLGLAMLVACTDPPAEWKSRINNAQMLYTDKEPENDMMVNFSQY